MGNIAAKLLCVEICALCSLLVEPVRAMDEERFWISREQIENGIDNCREGDCPRYREFTTRLFAPRSSDQMRRLMALLDFQSAALGLPVEHPETPQLCVRELPAHDEVIWNPEWMQQSNKLEALRNLEGLYVNVSGLKAPEGFEGEFGSALQKEVEEKFAAAGIRIVSKEEVDKVPGKPQLLVFFSATNPDTGCWWSVFSTMTQTAILTRDISVKLSVGSWSHMMGYNPDDLEMTEYGAISSVFDAFIEDFQAANSPELEPVNQVPYLSIDGYPMTIPKVYVKSYAEILAQQVTVTGSEIAIGDSADHAGSEERTVVKTDFDLISTKPELSPKTVLRMRINDGENLERDFNEIGEPSEKITAAGKS